MFDLKLSAKLLATQLVILSLVNCQQTSNPVACDFQTFENKNSPGGKLYGMVSLSDCQYQCRVTNGCLHGFDYNIVKGECWLSTRPFDGSSDSVGINHYSCLVDPTNPPPNPSMPPPTTKPPPRTPIIDPVPAPECSTWRTQPKTNSKNGKADTATTLKDCKDHCNWFNNGCALGFDWVESSQAKTRCYFSTTNMLGLLDGVTHYDCGPKPSLNSASKDKLFISGSILMIFAIIFQIIV